MTIAGNSEQTPGGKATPIASKWVGKRWGTLGDSITEAYGYQPIVASALGFVEVLNYGKGGCPMTGGGETDYGATINMSRGIDPTLDCVTVFAGVNDYRLHKPLGRMGDRDVFTFYGSYTTLVETVLGRNPGCRLNIWTPLHRDKDGYDIYRKNEQNHRLIDYVQAIRNIGEEYALPVLDLYAESGINRLNVALFTADGLHPNEAGHARIAGMAIAFLERL